MRVMTVFACAALLAAFPLSADEHEIIASAVDDAFDPPELTIQVGDTVRWTNKGNHPHNVSADDGSFRCAKGCDPGSDFAGTEAYHGPPPDTSPGDPSADEWSFALTFDEPGEIDYHCETHGAPGGIGMSGTVIVVEAEDPEPEFAINFGVTGSWFNPDTPGQGFLFDLVVAVEPLLLVVYWFTYANAESAPLSEAAGPEAQVFQEADGSGGPDAQRWLFAEGNFEEPADTVLLDVFLATGGVFDRDDPVDLDPIGSAELKFDSCTSATLTYDLDFDGDPGNNVTGSIPLVRLSPDVLCEELLEAGDGGA